MDLSTTTLRFHFPEYNNAYATGDRKHNQDFAVDLEWADVLTAIEKFAEYGNREAQCLQAVLRCISDHRDDATE